CGLPVGRSAPFRPPLRCAPRPRPWPTPCVDHPTMERPARRAVGAFPAAAAVCTKAAPGGQRLALTTLRWRRPARRAVGAFPAAAAVCTEAAPVANALR